MEGQVASFSYSTAAVIFIVYLVVDGLWTLYLKAAADNKKWLAANVSTAIRVLTVYGVVSYTQNNFYVIPLFAGAWLGTFLIVHFESKKDKNPVIDTKKLLAVLKERGIDIELKSIVKT